MTPLSLAVDPDGTSTAIKVGQGQQLIAPRKTGDASLTTVQVADIGSWRHGQLTYSNAPLNVVATDIARYLGKPIDVDAALAGRRFSGVLTVGDRSKLLPTFARIMAVSYRVEGNRILISPGPAR
jgi:transmembrane sensor